MPWMPHQHGGVTYEWSLATCGWIYLREVGAGKNYLKKWKRRREPYTVHDANRLVVDYLGEGQSAVHAAAPQLMHLRGTELLASWLGTHYNKRALVAAS